jgi:colanic acid/amylovoran biosynthesis glycosyltransferase
VNILYVTSMLPYGPKEAFFLPELQELRRQGHVVTVVPMWPRGAILHAAGTTLDVLTEPVFSVEVLWSAVLSLLRAPCRTLRSVALLFRSRSAATAAKNFGVVPKALWLARKAAELRTDHIHVQWAATTATMGLIASAVAGIPWSFTAHRWDIQEDNLLREKLLDARLVRAVSRRGAAALRTICVDRADSIYVGRVGVEIPADVAPLRRTSGKDLLIVVVANLVEVKGHAYLIEAIATARRQGLGVSMDIAGDGPMRETLRVRAKTLGVQEWVSFLGVLAHEALLADLRRGRWDAVVLPSIRTQGGDEEGVPVALVEAMAAGIPVVSTRTGAVEELLNEGAGILVPDRDPASLRDALKSLMAPEVAAQFASAGRARVVAEYDVARTTRELIEKIQDAQSI